MKAFDWFLVAFALFFLLVIFPAGFRMYHDAEDSRAEFDAQVRQPFLAHGVKLK